VNKAIGMPSTDEIPLIVKRCKYPAASFISRHP
jgi:hypothetical protein